MAPTAPPAQMIRRLPDEFLFRDGDVEGYDNLQIAELNLRLIGELEHLAVNSPEYICRAKAFHAEFRKPLRPG